MKTDSIFYRLFQTYPAALFELLGLPGSLAQGYEFRSVEVKETAFRLDGVFVSTQPHAPTYFVEVQFQRDEGFYARTLTEIFLYLRQNDPERAWHFVVLFAKRSIAPPLPAAYRLLAPNLRILYLNELDASENIGTRIVQLVVCPEREMPAKVPVLLAAARTLPDASLSAAIIDLIETVLVYKFATLSREEIAAMFGLSELKQTRVYQEARQEGIQVGRQVGRQEGRKEGEARLLLRLLVRRFGSLAPATITQIEALELEQLEELGEALLDFAAPEDLHVWLQHRTAP